MTIPLISRHEQHGAREGAPRILAILHQEFSSTGRVGQMLAERGFAIDICRPALGEDLPPTLEGHAGAIIFGGPMSANDPEEFIRRETAWIEVPLRENKPFLGICLGAQMLANHLGGRVESHPEGRVEIGWYPIEPTEAGSRLMDWPGMVYQFHREGLSLPRSAELLARGTDFPNQAFRYGENAWGIQFHAELTRAMLHRWIVRGADRHASLPGAQKGRDHLHGRLVWDRQLRDWLDRVLDRLFGTPIPARQDGQRPPRPADTLRA